MKRFVAVCLAATLVVGGLTACGENYEESNGSIEKLSEPDADATLESWMTKLDVRQGNPPIDLDTSTMYVEEMPEIDKAFQFTVDGKADLDLEIWVSTERSGEGNDGWINRVTENFNRLGAKTQDGRSVSVSIRSIDAGAQLDYLVQTDVRPDAWSVANALWNEMAVSRGVNSALALARSAGNTAGILMKKTAYDEYTTKYGDLSLEELITSVTNQETVLGFTNPYTSDTALNMLYEILRALDPTNPLSADAAERFNAFQAYAPPPAYTTAQMRQAAISGFIDVMTMECQAYSNEPTLNDYVFTPFGVRHDNPVYTFTDLPNDRKEALKLWVDYISNDECQKLATSMGFNKYDEYVGANAADGPSLYAAQSLWKGNKSGGKPTVAVFVADVSGSMAGVRLKNLQTSMLNSIQYIGEENEIGLVSFSDTVTVELPLGKFRGEQRARFQGAVKGLVPSGGTHMYSGILAALNMIKEHKSESESDVNYMVFVLTDGETNGGLKEDICSQLVASYGIPCHTIGYGNEVGAEPLKRLSSIAEGFSLMLTTDDVVYNMKNMFNSQM